MLEGTDGWIFLICTRRKKKPRLHIRFMIVAVVLFVMLQLLSCTGCFTKTVKFINMPLVNANYRSKFAMKAINMNLQQLIKTRIKFIVCL